MVLVYASCIYHKGNFVPVVIFCHILQCKPGYAGNGELCGVDSDNDGLPDTGLSCTDWGCNKV